MTYCAATTSALRLFGSVTRGDATSFSDIDVFVAQKDLAIAVAEGAGQTVQVALLQLNQAQARLEAAQQAGLQGAQLDVAQASVIRAPSMPM